MGLQVKTGVEIPIKLLLQGPKFKRMKYNLALMKTFFSDVCILQTCSFFKYAEVGGTYNLFKCFKETTVCQV